jgi:mannose-6-phosphate isomerase-like protein (cupin superfamily)
LPTAGLPGGFEAGLTAPAPELRRPDPREELLAAEQCHILETWNRADDPDLSVARARVAPGVTTRWHRLQGISERYLIVSGHGLAEVEGMDPATVRPGDLLYIPAGHAQRIRNTGTSDLLFYALCTPRFRWSAYDDLEAPAGD